MEKIIGLYESANQGKTSTLNDLIDILKVRTLHCEMPEPVSEDRREVFNYHGKIIGIATPGDSQWELEQNCSFFDENRCDIAITATRSKEWTCDFLEKYAKKHKLKVDWIKKTVCEEPTLMEAANLIQAYRILDLIE